MDDRTQPTQELSDASRADAPAGVSASAILLIFALVSAAATIHWGAFKWHALALMLVAVGACFYCHLRPLAMAVKPNGLLLGILLASLAAMAYMPAGQNQYFETYKVPGLGRLLKHANPFGRAIQILSGVGFMVGLTYLLQMRDKDRTIARGRFVILLLLAISVRPLMLKSTPVPQIDVYTSQTAGAKGLLLQITPKSQREAAIQLYASDPDEAATLRQSRNVYSMVFPKPTSYLPPAFKGQRRDRAGKAIPFAWFDHYGYPPATVYANAVSWWAFKDVRVGWLICDLAAALCLYLVARHVNGGPQDRRTAELLTLVFLFMPRSLFVLEQSWTEPLCLATMGVFAVFMLRATHPVWRGVLMGLFSSKQYIILAAPMIFRLRRCRLITWIVCGLVGVGLFVPFILWDWQAVYHDVLGFFLKSEVRPDALSICGAFKRYGREMPWFLTTSLWLGSILFFSATMKRTVAGMLFATAATWLFFFLLGKQAFMNYWHLILYALLLAAAATPAGRSSHQRKAE